MATWWWVASQAAESRPESARIAGVSTDSLHECIYCHRSLPAKDFTREHVSRSIAASRSPAAGGVSGGDHQYMKGRGRKLRIPNPHANDIGHGLLVRILRQAGIFDFVSPTILRLMGAGVGLPWD